MSVPKQYLDPEIECASTDEMRQLQTERLKRASISRTNGCYGGISRRYSFY